MQNRRASQATFARAERSPFPESNDLGFVAKDTPNDSLGKEIIEELAGEQLASSCLKKISKTPQVSNKFTFCQKLSFSKSIKCVKNRY